MNQTTKFRRLAESRFHQINPHVVAVKFHWEFTSNGFVPNRVGNGATMHGHFTAEAQGHRHRRVMVTMEQGASDVTLR